MSHWLVRTFAAAVLLFAWTGPVKALLYVDGEGETAGTSPVAMGASNYMEAKQLSVGHAQLSGIAALGGEKNVTAWQVTQGKWNGQSLDGLSMVLVRSRSAEAVAGGKAVLHCYISHFATPAQRAALVAAFTATQLQGFSRRELSAMRIEPAVILLEFDGQTLVLHLGMIA